MAGTYETQGSKRVYFSDLLPKGDSGATADSLFNKDLLRDAGTVYVWGTQIDEKMDKKTIKRVKYHLKDIKYLVKDYKVTGVIDEESRGAAHRYVMNFQRHPKNTMSGQIMEWMKGLF